MNGTNRNTRIARKLGMIATILGLWGALVLLFAAPLALTSSVPWRQTLKFAASFWALWLLFMPVSAWLAFRFPIQRRNLLRNVLLHLFACLLLVATNRAAVRAISQLAPRPPHSEEPRPVSNARPGSPGLPAAFGVFLGFRAALDVLVYWSLVGACQAITYFRMSQARERRAAELEARLASSQLHALRMQINPHFLFNTLNSIAALVYTNPRAADEMLGDLSELLRRSLDTMEEQEISLSQELEFVGTYLNIEQKRFGERLRVKQHVPSELMQARVPALILQPLVENAIRHGIEPQRGPGLISIEAKREGNHLHLTIRDNGKGLTNSEPNATSFGGARLQPSQTIRRGIGLANTKARLQALYGSNQTFSVTKAEPSGCQVDICLPFHLQPLHASTLLKQPVA